MQTRRVRKKAKGRRQVIQRARRDIRRTGRAPSARPNQVNQSQLILRRPSEASSRAATYTVVPRVAWSTTRAQRHISIGRKTPQQINRAVAALLLRKVPAAPFTLIMAWPSEECRCERPVAAALQLPAACPTERDNDASIYI